MVVLAADAQPGSRDHCLPIRVTSIPLQPVMVASTAVVSLDLGSVIDKVGSDIQGASQDLALFTAEPRYGLHVLVDSNRHRDELTKRQLLLTVKREGAQVDFGPVYSFDGTGTKVVILSSFSQDEGKSHTPPSVPVLPTPPPSPQPPTVIPPLLTVLEGGDDAGTRSPRPPTSTSIGREQGFQRQPSPQPSDATTTHPNQATAALLLLMIPSNNTARQSQEL